MSTRPIGQPSVSEYLSPIGDAMMRPRRRPMALIRAILGERDQRFRNAEAKNRPLD